MSFTTNNPLILQGEDLPDRTASFIQRTDPYPTSALDANSIPLRLKLLVANLQDPTTGNTKIKIGPFGCDQAAGKADIETIVAHSNGHVITVILPEGKA